MHFIVAIWAALACIRWGDWRNWRTYIHTILYMSASNLLYFYLTSDYRLWQVIPDTFLTQKGTDLLYSFIVFPFTVVLFLSNYPKERRYQIVYLLKWVFIYAGVELIGVYTGKISYAHGWTYGWSVFFLCHMFPMLYIHHVKPLFAYGLSVFWVMFYLLLFDVPL